MTITLIPNEITMELLTDISVALHNVARDFLPTSQFVVHVSVHPPEVVLRVPGETNKAVQAALYELAESVKSVTVRTLPSLPLRYTVIGGSEASGIVIEPEPGAEPIYGHIIKAKVTHLVASSYQKGTNS